MVAFDQGGGNSGDDQRLPSGYTQDRQDLLMRQIKIMKQLNSKDFQPRFSLLDFEQLPQQPVHFFCKGSGSKYVQLCTLYGLCCNYLILT